MFSFLNPLMLFGLIAGAIPLIIHFLTKRKAKQVFFGSIRFLKEMEENKRSRINIDFFLLLLLRILIILLFCAALARPLTSLGFLGSGKKEARTVILLIDNSYSMGYRDGGDTLFNKAKKKAKEIIDGISIIDEANIIFFNERPENSFNDFTNNKQALNNILQERELSSAKTRGQNALNLAFEMFGKSKNPEKLLYIFSDFQKNGFSDMKSAEGIKIIPVFTQPPEVSNLTVTGVEFPNYISFRNTTRISVHLKNTGREKKPRAAIYLEKNKIGEKEIDLQSNSEGEAVFFYSFPEKGVYKGFVEVEGSDNLKIDNRFYFCVEVRDPLQVLLLNDSKDSEEENFYIKQALFSAKDSPVVLKTLTLQRQDYSILKPFSVIILNNVSRIDEKLQDALLKNLNSGGGILITLGNNISIKDYSGNSPLFPAKPQFKIGSEEETSKYFKITSFDRLHPIFKIFTSESFSSSHFYSFYSAKVDLLDPDTRVLAGFDDGSPFIIEKKYGEGKVLLFTSSLDSNWSDFPLRPNYLPLLHQAVYYLAQPKDLKQRQLILEGEFYKREPGFSLIKEPNDYIALNLALEESELFYFPADEINKKLAGAGSNSKKISTVSYYKEEISSILLILVLILLIFENIISNKDAKFIE
ncbi:MAG: BatA and WFA domain-containing protein [bacterium]|nr:BatA and WFA domain-containing protein [bacterium]